jgi:hypothetical protein
MVPAALVVQTPEEPLVVIIPAEAVTGKVGMVVKVTAPVMAA